MSKTFNESSVEAAALSYFSDLGYETLHGPDIAPDEPTAERASYGDVVLLGRLRDSLQRINPGVPAQALLEAVDVVLRVESPSLVEINRRFHRLLVEGVPVEAQDDTGEMGHYIVRLVDFDNPEANDWLALNQFTVIEAGHNRRPDVVVFVNGLPLAVMELKNPLTQSATLTGAFNQLQTYKAEIPGLFAFNELCVISDGVQARVGTLTATREWFTRWRTVDGRELAPKGSPELSTLTRGIFDKERFLDLIQYFVVFERAGRGDLPVKKLAAYHQYFAVGKAVESTVEASSLSGEGKAGVVWHTQGSGKSLSMTFYAGKIIRRPEMENPTLVVITDRNDLDDQLFGTFAACSDVLRQTPVQAESRQHLRELLDRAAGGVVFTTIQKFSGVSGNSDNAGAKHPTLSERRNVVVIADEAHRSQYDFMDGFAANMRQALPKATYIGFTGTPIELGDKNTKKVFGHYVDVYDIQQAVEDGATVPVYYEARVAKLDLDKEYRPEIDPKFEEVTEGEEESYKAKARSRWSRMEALVGSERRVNAVASDIADHFDKRLEGMEGKGMVVCMSRRICVAMYDAITKIRPDWHSEDDAQGQIKVVMTGSAADPQEWQLHVRNKAGNDAIARRLKDADDPLRLVIVRDMWLTGFDAPPLHTMYVDKQMRGHSLMQAIARVNRVYEDKQGGLVVDYLGIAGFLQEALAEYTAKDREETAVPQDKAAELMQEKYEVVAAMLHGFDYSKFFDGNDAERLDVVSGAMNHVLGLEDGRSRYLQAVSHLSQAFALAVPHEYALSKRDELRFFKSVASVLTKTTAGGRASEDIDLEIGQLVSNAVSSGEIVDVFSANGLNSPDISILSDEFLEEVDKVPRKNLALAMFHRLLKAQIKVRGGQNAVEAKRFSDTLEAAINRYNNQALSAAEVLEELIKLAKEMRAAYERGDALGLTDDEVAFFDALSTNDSAVNVMGDDKLKMLARELVESVRKNITIDWRVREDARARMRVLIRKLLRKHGYPPDMQQDATVNVLVQAELFGDNIVVSEPVPATASTSVPESREGQEQDVETNNGDWLSSLQRELEGFGLEGAVQVSFGRKEELVRRDVTPRSFARDDTFILGMMAYSPEIITHSVEVVNVVVPYLVDHGINLATDAAILGIVQAVAKRLKGQNGATSDETPDPMGTPPVSENARIRVTGKDGGKVTALYDKDAFGRRKLVYKKAA